MTGKQYRAALDRLGLTQAQAARLLQVNPRTSRKWALSERPIPGIAAEFLTYLEQTQNTPAFARLKQETEL